MLLSEVYDVPQAFLDGYVLALTVIRLGRIGFEAPSFFLANAPRKESA